MPGESPPEALAHPAVLASDKMGALGGEHAANAPRNKRMLNVAEIGQSVDKQKPKTGAHLCLRVRLQLMKCSAQFLKLLCTRR